MHDLALQASPVWKSTARTASIIGQGASCEESTFLVCPDLRVSFNCNMVQLGTRSTKHADLVSLIRYQVLRYSNIKHILKPSTGIVSQKKHKGKIINAVGTSAVALCCNQLAIFRHIWSWTYNSHEKTMKHLIFNDFYNKDFLGLLWL